MNHIHEIISMNQTAVAFGAFDGMHIGHKAIIDILCAQNGLTPVVVSFEDEVNPIVYTESEKAYLLKDSKVDTMLSIPVDAVESMGEESFVKDILVGKLNAKTVVMGENHDKLALYSELGKLYGFDVVTVPTVKLNGEEASTEAIKNAIANNDTHKLFALLGRSYIMQGVVVHGKAQGRKFGMPTANLGIAKNKLFPPYGVYATLTHMDKAYPGMTNIGLRPSDDDMPHATVETFLLDFSGDLYDKPLTLEVFYYVRGTKKFPGGLAELKKQIDQDIQDCRDFLESVTK